MKHWIIILLLGSGLAGVSGQIQTPEQAWPVEPVTKHGQLHVSGTKLMDEHNQPVILRGMSFGWHNFWPRFYHADAVKWLHQDWACSVVRAAMGIELWDGYKSRPEWSVSKIKTVVDAAIAENIYVIIDWHSHNINLEEAKAFFTQMAAEYGKYPHVIYEIFNEPDYESWAEVKAFSVELIKIIRAIDPDNIILVSSTHWAQDLNVVADDPLIGFTNLMYTMHFYAGTHKQWLRDRCDDAMKKGIPIFVSECAGMDATGDGPIDREEFLQFITWMEKAGISWLLWSVSDKDESCSVLRSTANTRGNWPESDLKDWGILSRQLIRQYNFQIPFMTRTITVRKLLSEMIDLKALAERPSPWFRQSQASSYDRKSHEGGESWFANYDVGQYVRTEVNDGRKEQVLADLTGPGAISRFWTANPDLKNVVRFYFDGEKEPRLLLPLDELFTGRHPLFGPEFSYLSGTGGNLYFPIPYNKSLKITIGDKPGTLRLYYEIGYRTYETGTLAETFDPARADSWLDERIRAGRGLTRPEGVIPLQGTQWKTASLIIPPGKSGVLPLVNGEQAVFSFSARVDQTEESSVWTDPMRAHVALRHLLLDISFDDEPGIRSPLGDFFGSGPGINPYENLFFTVSKNGWMTSRLLMPFKKSMRTEVFNAGLVPYTIEMSIGICPFVFTENTYHLHAQWGTLTRESWPPFDVNFLNTTGEGKVIGTVYQIANPSYIWWGEGDQKIFVDGEQFPSTFGTGTEDDYGYAYGNNERFTRPYHAQTRVDGPASGGHISLNRWYVLDALPYRTSIRFDQEIWHWMPCNPVWSHVIYWYAQPGTPGPLPVDRQSLMPMDLGIRENMLELIEGEDLTIETTEGTAGSERLANCSGARHLVWKNASPGDHIRIHFNAPAAGKYEMMVNLCQSPVYGKYHFKVNGQVTDQVVDAWSAKLFWIRPVLGRFQLKQGDNILEVSLLEPNPQAKPGNLFGLDYLFLIRQD